MPGNGLTTIFVFASKLGEVTLQRASGSGNRIPGGRKKGEERRNGFFDFITTGCMRLKIKWKTR